MNFSKKLKLKPASTTFIDSNGIVSNDNLEHLFPYTDGFMLDLKSLDKDIHNKLTGMNNEQVLKSIVLTAQKGLLYEIRTVIVENYNDSEKEIVNICNFILTNAPKSTFKLIGFRPNGVKTDLKNLQPFSQEKLHNLYEIAKRILGNKVVKV